MPHLYSPWENGFEKPDYLAIWIFFLLKYAPTYAALGKVVVKSKYVLAVVKALDVVAGGSVVRAPKMWFRWAFQWWTVRATGCPKKNALSELCGICVGTNFFGYFEEASLQPSF